MKHIYNIKISQYLLDLYDKIAINRDYLEKQLIAF